jgi:hypothetical protein
MIQCRIPSKTRPLWSKYSYVVVKKPTSKLPPSAAHAAGVVSSEAHEERTHERAVGDVKFGAERACLGLGDNRGEAKITFTVS